MTRLRTFALTTFAIVTLSACSGGLAGDEPDEVFLITHTTQGTLYWE